MVPRGSERNRAVIRLWALDSEYEELKAGLDDPKVMLTALKQQADLLLDISKLDGDGYDGGASAEIGPEEAVNELRAIFAKLGPVLAG
ncbi:MAG: hypothetical protein Kow00107_01090 [Planctomycetota bacterium]